MGGRTPPSTGSPVMIVLVWLAVPVTATLLAVLWGTLASRTRGSRQAVDSVRDYERFRQAMSTGPRTPESAASSKGHGHRRKQLTRSR